MATFGNWPLLERFTNNEFIKLLPILNLEQQFLTQVYIPKKKWLPFLDANSQTLQVKCNVCNVQMRFEDLKSHLVQNDHDMSLRSLNLKQFYHPFYTYGKGDKELARGEPTPQKVRENALREVNVQMKSFRKEFLTAKQLVNVIKQRMQLMEENHLIEKMVFTKIKNPDDMVVMATLPFEDIPKLLFRGYSTEWQAVLSYKSLTRKTTFYCNICRLNCSGIENLNSHLKGLTHRVNQLELLSLCYESSSKVNKNCCVQFGSCFSFSIIEGAKGLSRNQFENDLNLSKLPSDISTKVKALNAYVPKLYTDENCDLDQKNVKIDTKLNEKFASDKNLGHLGVEYVLRIMKSENDRDPTFECGLCEFIGNDIRMQSHLLSYEHKKKYLDLHYSDTVRKYEDLIGHMSFKEFRSVMNEVVTKLAIEIENHHSRSLPYTVSAKDYNSRRPDLISEMYALLHASQNRGPSFSNILSKDDIAILKNSVKQLIEKKKFNNTEYVVFTMPPKLKIYLNQMNHDPVIRLTEYNAKMNKNRTTKTSHSISPVQKERYIARNDSRTERPRVQEHHRSRSQSPKRLKQSFVGRNHNIWDIYRRELAFAANKIEAAYEKYRENPESHPLYENEWNDFWQRRKKELEREGYNYRSYDFQPEWVQYFKQRIEALFGEELHNSKISIRHRLDIPLDAEEDCQRSRETVNQREFESLNVEAINKFQRHKRPNSPDLRENNSHKRQHFSEIMQEQRNDSFNTNESLAIVPKVVDNHSNVIHVLRLMTALEEHLGRLGGKIIDLLSNALQLEKNFRGNNIEFEAKVLTVANCHLLETAMEKLKGILYAGLLDEKKISGFNRVLQHTANLLKYAEKMGWRQKNNASGKIDVHTSNDQTGPNQINSYAMPNSYAGNFSHMSTKKSLSDTLIGLVDTPHSSKQQQLISKGHFSTQVKEEIVCPPPPNIRVQSKNKNSITTFNEQQTHSGLASFNTKLSLYSANQSQTLQPDLSIQPAIRQVTKNIVSGGNNLYNNSFRNNNDTRTNKNINTINGRGMEETMNNTDGTSDFKYSQFIPKMGQNYQGDGGVNRFKWHNK